MVNSKNNYTLKVVGARRAVTAVILTQVTGKSRGGQDQVIFA